MTPTTAKPGVAQKRRGRPRKVESYADWMARVDAQVDSMAREVAKQPPTYAWLHPAQRRIVQMLIEHLRSLPELKAGESAYGKEDYSPVNQILTVLFKCKYPEWQLRTKTGNLDVFGIPNGEGKDFGWMLRNCAGEAPAEQMVSIVISKNDADDD